MRVVAHDATAAVTLGLDTPIGRLHLESDGQSLVGIHLPPGAEIAGLAHDGAPVRPGVAAPVLRRASQQLLEYFAGTRTAFDLPLALGGTTFQRSVWDELGRIPYGRTITYGELAHRVGRPRGPRAVGQANGRNPIPIVVPCHRVVASDGIGGYSGGLAVKRALLALEGAEASRPAL